MTAATTARFLRWTLASWCLAAAAWLAPAARAGEIHGGIEIGGAGIKMTAIELSGSGDNIDIQIKLADTVGGGISGAASSGGSMWESATGTTAQVVEKFRDRLRSLGVADEHIHVIGSSGIFAAIHDKPELIELYQKKLAARIMRDTGLTMVYINAKREAELSIAGILPSRRRATGVLIDIGGGNTKGGCLLADGKYATFSIPYGTVTFADYARQKNADHPAHLGDLIRLGAETLPPLLKKELGKLPDMGQRDRVYLSGGVIWAVATFTHPGDSQPYMPLTLKDVEDFEAKLLAAPARYPKLDVSGLSEQKQRRATAEATKLKSIYTPTQLLAGTQVLKNTLRVVGGDRHYFFARHGSLGWLLAYVTASARGEKP
jgi:hypothetical protein